MPVPADWTPGQWTGEEEDSEEECRPGGEENDSLMFQYNEALSRLSEKVKVGNFTPLTFQLNTTWEEATQEEKEICIDKAMEGCKIVCEVIAPKAGDELLQSCVQLPDQETETVSDELITLMQAHKNAPTRNLKTQILSLYAYQYSAKKLKKLHEPYERITDWQIKRARAHARECGPGFAVEKSTSHRVRLNKVQVDHFIDFINRPYFYQDVAYGTRTLNMDSGAKLKMPNVIRTVTRSTMCGVDNTAADGSAGFEKLCKIVDDLQELGQDDNWSKAIKKSLLDGKRYLKTQYRNHCQESESPCPDHCLKFGLSDPKNAELNETCAHEHTTRCNQCDNISTCINKIERAIKHEGLAFYSKEQQEDIVYDFEQAVKAIKQWKAHVMRTTNQERAKQDVLAKLDSSSRLVVMDWAMKFLQLRYREKQSDWYGKRGLSWHVSSVVSRDELTKKLQVTTYAHLFDQCTQDWFAVASIIEHLLTHLKAKHPSLDSVYFRSDEAGCYHNNLLVAAVRDIGERFGITVKNYDFSKPQSGKDICDRIICPLKASIREHCSEGHDILTASDMKEALKQHPVSGTSASVNVVDKSRESLEVNELDNFGAFHNFHFESSGILAWKAYGIGSGKLFPYKALYVKHQGPTMLQTEGNDAEHWFYSVKERDLNPERKKQPTASESLFECSVSGCTQAFALFSELESHLNVGQHMRIQATSESFYDKVRKDWAGKFASVDVASQTKCYGTSTSATSTSLATSSSIGYSNR
jgi:uncharacterized protein YggL (DUF469 family)